MNWLAHLYLSDPTPAYRIGNLLPDIVPVSLLTAVPPEYRLGIKCHHRIDSFTDSHEIVGRSIRRIGAPYRRYAGILVDIFYDHYLSRDWSQHSPVPLLEFVTEFHDSIEECCNDLPLEAVERLRQIRRGNWLSSYGDFAGLEETLYRLGQRFSRPVDLSGAIAELKMHYEALDRDFREFFPELAAHVGR